MQNEVNVQRSRLLEDGMLHIEFLDGNSYLYSLQEIVDIIAAQQSVQRTAIAAGGLGLLAGFIIGSLVGLR